MEFYLQDSAATEALGRLLGKHAASGDVFCLSGDLGAGKTLLSRGVAVALGAEAEDVNSPTFAIMNVYQGRELEIRHFDLYRLNRPEELEDIVDEAMAKAREEYAGGDGVTLIEWAELFKDELPEEYLQITLLHDGEGRRAVLQAQGERYEKLLREVEKDADFGN